MDAPAPPAPDPQSILTKSPSDLRPKEIAMLQRQVAMLAEHNQYLTNGVKTDAMHAFKQGRHQIEQQLRADHISMIAAYQHNLNVEAHKVAVLQQRLHQATQEIYGYRQFIEQRLGKGASQYANPATKRSSTPLTPQATYANKRQRLDTADRYSTTTASVSSPHLNAASEPTVISSTGTQNNHPPASRPVKTPVSRLSSAQKSASYQMQSQQPIPGSFSPQPQNEQLQNQQNFGSLLQMPAVPSQQPQQMASQNMGTLHDMQLQAHIQSMRRAQQMGQVNAHNSSQMQMAPQAGMNGVQMAQMNGTQFMFRHPALPKVSQFHSKAAEQAFLNNIMQRQQAAQQSIAQMQGHPAFQSQTPMNSSINMPRAPVLPSSQPLQQNMAQVCNAPSPTARVPKTQRARVVDEKIEKPRQQNVQQGTSRMGGNLVSSSRVSMNDLSSVSKAAPPTTPQMDTMKDVPQNGTATTPVDLVSPTLHSTSHNTRWESPESVEHTEIQTTQPMSQQMRQPGPEFAQAEEVAAMQTISQNTRWLSPEAEEIPTVQPASQHLERESSGADEVRDVLETQFQSEQTGWASPTCSVNENTDDSAITFTSASSKTPPTSVENNDQSDQLIAQEAPQETGAGRYDNVLANDHYANYKPAITTLPHDLPSLTDNLFGEVPDYIGDDKLTALLEKELRQGRLDIHNEHLNSIGHFDNACIDPALLELPGSTTNHSSGDFGPQHGDLLAQPGSNNDQVHPDQDSLNKSNSIPINYGDDNNPIEPRKVVCIHCYTHWWEATCDLGQPCQNCRGRTDCVRPRCPDDAAGNCMKGDHCKMVHRSDTYYRDPYLVDVQKLPKRDGKKANAKTAPSVLAKRKLQTYGLAEETELTFD